MGLPTLSLVFSFRNEEQVIPELLRRCRLVGAGLKNEGRIASYEFIFVDDDSTDQSYYLLKKEADGFGDVKVIRMSRRFGVSACVLAGMRYSTGDWVVYMDADLQDPPELIPEMIRAVESDPEVAVVHTRRLHRDGEGAFKLWVTRIGYILLHLMTRSQLPIECGDFKLLTRRAVVEVLKFQEKKPFMRWLICLVGFKQVFIPYRREPRGGGETHFNILSWKVISNFLESAFVSTSVFPLHIISAIGILSSSICGFTLIYILIQKILGYNLPGWTAIMAAILFVGSIQILSIGLLGLYIGSIFEEVKGRPNYIVDQAYGFPGRQNDIPATDGAVQDTKKPA